MDCDLDFISFEFQFLKRLDVFIMACTKQTARKMLQQYPKVVFAPSTSEASTSRASAAPPETGETRDSTDIDQERGMYIFCSFEFKFGTVAVKKLKVENTKYICINY